jgi:phosphinothricin acetyltransferase
MNPQVPDAIEADIPASVDNDNQAIPGAWSTADTKPVTVAERMDWFRKHDPLVWI